MHGVWLSTRGNKKMPPKTSRREKIKRKRLERKTKKKHRPKVEKKPTFVPRRRIRRRRNGPQSKHSAEEVPDGDDHDINKMRKLLKMKKNKKGLPLSFKQDGLDCIHTQ